MAFLHGFCLALGLILPLGVQNLFVFQQGITQPRLVRIFPAVITAALCDTVLIVLSVGGMSVILMNSLVMKNILVLGGVVFLLYMGYVTWHSKPKEDEVRNVSFSAKRQITFAMSVSFLNPYAFLDILGVIGTSSLQYEAEEKILFTMACIMVSWLWFFALGIAGRVLGKRKNIRGKMQTLNRVSAMFIFGTAAYMLSTVIK